MNKLISTVLLTLLVGGCVSSAGVGEFRVYTEAINTLVTVSEPMADQLRVAERERGLKLIDEDGGVVAGVTAGAPIDGTGIAPEFHPEHAAYFAESGDTPLAGAIRASAAALKRYSDALLIYANGEALDAARADLSAVSGDVSLGMAALGGGGGSTVFAVADEAVSAAGAFGSRAAFQSLLREQGGALDDLLGAMIDNSPAVYRELVAADNAKLEDIAVSKGDGAEIVSRMKTKRSLVAEWVLLTQSARALLADALAAIDRPATISENLATIAALSGDTRIRAARIRALLAQSN